MYPKRIKYTKDLLEPIIKSSFTWVEVCKKLGLKGRTGAQSHLKKKAESFKISFFHFTGKSSIKGRISPNKKHSLEYCYDGCNINSHTLKLKLISDGIKKYECELCGLEKWMSDEIPLELDHKNSNHKDNRLENLQIICANCHSLETKNRIKIKKLCKVKKEKIKHEKNKRFCINCNNEIFSKRKTCNDSCFKNHRNKNIPSLEILKDAFIEYKNLVKVGKHFNVSDNAVRKWCLKYNLSINKINKCYEIEKVS